MSLLLNMVNVSAWYGKAQALNRVSIIVNRGEIVSLLGANGAGKTTLLKSISRVVKTDGNISINDILVNEKKIYDIVGMKVCQCVEGRHLFLNMSVFQNLQLGAYRTRHSDVIDARMQEVFRIFPILKDRKDQKCNTLSGGQQQFVAIGRALMGGPELLLLDEPSVGIAHKTRIEIFDAIKKISESGIGVLVAEQDASNALRISDRAYVLDGGKIGMAGRSEELMNNQDIKRIYLGL